MFKLDYWIENLNSIYIAAAFSSSPYAYGDEEDMMIGFGALDKKS